MSKAYDDCPYVSASLRNHQHSNGWHGIREQDYRYVKCKRFKTMVKPHVAERTVISFLPADRRGEDDSKSQHSKGDIPVDAPG